MPLSMESHLKLRLQSIKKYVHQNSKALKFNSKNLLFRLIIYTAIVSPSVHYYDL